MPLSRWAQGHSEGCRARLEAEIAKTEEGRIRLTTAYLRGLGRESAGAPGAVPVPPNPGVQDIPMDGHRESAVQKMPVM